MTIKGRKALEHQINNLRLELTKEKDYSSGLQNRLVALENSFMLMLTGPLLKAIRELFRQRKKAKK